VGLRTFHSSAIAAIAVLPSRHFVAGGAGACKSCVARMFIGTVAQGVRETAATRLTLNRTSLR
jgi:hypothetical protein